MCPKPGVKLMVPPEMDVMVTASVSIVMTSFTDQPVIGVFTLTEVAPAAALAAAVVEGVRVLP